VTTKTQFNLKTTPQNMVKQLTKWAESLSPKEKAKARESLISQLKDNKVS
jgi:hypothetical protein